MVNNHDRERASAVLSSALDTIGKPRERWLLKLLQGGDTEHHIILRNRREAIGGHLSWKRPGRRVVPDDQIPNFVVDSLGLDILRFIEIRFLLIEHTRMSNSSNFSLLVESLTSYSGLGVEASVEDLSSIEIGMGTKIARDFCRNVGLPMSFSTRGSRDDRLAQEVVQ